MFACYLFDGEVFDHLPKGERSKYQSLLKANSVPKGRPFYIGGDGLPDLDLDGFCEYLIHPRRASPKTWATYAGQVSLFIRFMAAQGKSWKQAASDDLKHYYVVRTTGEFQDGPILKGQSWNVAKSAIVHLYEYAAEAGLISDLPFKYKKSKAMFGYGVALTSDLGAKFTPEPLNFIGIQDYKSRWRPELQRRQMAQRNLAITDLLVTVGLRISEALSLQIHQVPDPDDNKYAGRKSISIRVMGKGKKPRIVRIPKRIARAIRFYVEEDRQLAVEFLTCKYGAKATEPTAVFLSRKGTVLSARSVQSLFKAISISTGIQLTPHGCRHTFAVYQLEAMIKRMATNLRELRATGADAYRQILNDPLRQLQLLLGHEHISTTYIYLDFLEESEAIVDESLSDWTSWGNDHEQT
jgi:site-specific recombinase XerD